LFVDLNDIVAKQYDKLGKEKVDGLFQGDHTHTNAEGARLNASSVVEGIKELKDCPLRDFLAK
jgi:rhamnogalacturonan acetylesterase